MIIRLSYRVYCLFSVFCKYIYCLNFNESDATILIVAIIATNQNAEKFTFQEFILFKHSVRKLVSHKIKLQS